jgi:hypothetical protein
MRNTKGGFRGIRVDTKRGYLIYPEKSDRFLEKPLQNKHHHGEESC